MGLPGYLLVFFKISSILSTLDTLALNFKLRNQLHTAEFEVREKYHFKIPIT